MMRIGNGQRGLTRTWVAVGVAVSLISALAMSDAATAQGKKQNAWVKLCNKQQTPKRDSKGQPVRKADGQPELVVQEMCLTHHERIDGRTGVVLVSAAIRQIKGAKARTLLLMVPLGMAIKPGVKAAIYSPAQWTKASKGEKIDPKAIAPMKLDFTMCHASGCFAEMPATPELVQSMKSGGGMMVGAINAIGRPVVLPVDLTGFTKAIDGPPVDNKLYAEARRNAMIQIAENRKRLLAEAKKKREIEALLDKQKKEEAEAKKKAAGQ